MTGAVLLVTDFVFGTATAVVSAAVVFAAFGGLWFALPVWRRLTE
jgi:hypothetical protein